MTGELPQPVTRTDELLAAVHQVLEEILDRLPARQEPTPAGPGPVTVDISEPGGDPES